MNPAKTTRMRLMALFFTLLSASQVGADEPYLCDDPFFRISGDRPELAPRACQAATRGRDSLMSCNIELPAPLEIEIVEVIDGDLGSCLGLYHCGEDHIKILSPEALSNARDPEGAFAGISNDAYWDSILVHEMTHAAFDQVNCPFTSCVATSEYASYAMQVNSLAPEDQQIFGQSVELKSKPNSGAISAMIYFMSPDRFAKYAWLHFSSRPDPCAYMSLIMDGKVFFDMEPL